MLSARDYIRTAKQLGFSVVDGGYDSNFQDAITRTGFVQKHHIAFSGGTNDGNYRASVGVMQHEMVVKITESRNFTAKFDLIQRAFDKLLEIDFWRVWGDTTQQIHCR